MAKPVESLKDVLKQARLHGEDEVGDLQDMCRLMWDLLPKTKRKLFIKLAEKYFDMDEVAPATCPRCGKPAVVDCGDGSGFFSSECIEGRCEPKKKGG